MKNRKVSDRKLQQLLTTDLDKALIEIERRFSGRLLRYFHKRIRCRHTAEELVQETMLRVVSKGHTYCPDRGKFSSWIWRIAKNVFCSLLRSPPYRTRSMERPLNGDYFASHTTESAESLTEAKEQQAAIRDAVAMLPEKKCDVVRRFYLAQQSIAAIALTLSIPEGTVKSQLASARAALTTLIDLPQ